MKTRGADLMVLLLIDQLGMRHRWKSGGREAAEEAFETFRAVIADRISKKTNVISAHIEADSAAIVCKTLAAGIEIGREIFRAAFRAGSARDSHRIWLRGVIVPFEKASPLRIDLPLFEAKPHITVGYYSHDLLNAIAVEKSGFKGMRLLIVGIQKKEIKRSFSLRIAEFGLTPIKRIVPPGYPAQLGAQVYDLLWMSSGSEGKWKEFNVLMARRLRWAAENPDEFLQAAATQIVFTHCGGMFAGFQNTSAIKRANAGGSL